MVLHPNESHGCEWEEEGEERRDEKEMFDDASAILGRVAKHRNFGIEDLGSYEWLELRKEDDVDLMQGLVRIRAAEIAGMLDELREKDVANEDDGMMHAHVLKVLKDSSPFPEIDYYGGESTLYEVAAAIPCKSEFLKAYMELDDPTIHFINENGELVMSDGTVERPADTQGSFYRCRGEAREYTYIDENEKAVTVHGEEQIPKDAKIIMRRGLPTIEEYQRMNFGGQYERSDDGNVWLESDEEYPETAYFGFWTGRGVDFDGTTPHTFEVIGTRRVVRVKLDASKLKKT